MPRWLLALLVALNVLPSSGMAQNAGPQIAPVTELDESILPPAKKRRQIGRGRMFTNDFLGDRYDRWQTGSYTFSRVWAWDSWQGRAPAGFGNLLEMRIGGRIITPENLRTFVPTDRPWAGSLNFGLHTHWSRGNTEFALGSDLVVIGPQTQLDHLQELLHDMFDAPIPRNAVLSRQIGNQVWPTLVGEVGHTIQIGGQSRLRPYAELRAGDESLVRFGADLTIGTYGLGELMARENVTGQRYRVVQQETPGMSFVFGADVAHVFDSVYLPSSRGFQLTDTRNRVRAGFHWQGETSSVFYGATWLDREFTSQRESQLVGSVRLQFQF